MDEVQLGFEETLHIHIPLLTKLLQHLLKHFILNLRQATFHMMPNNARLLILMEETYENYSPTTLNKHIFFFLLSLLAFFSIALEMFFLWSLPLLTLVIRRDFDLSDSLFILSAADLRL